MSFNNNYEKVTMGQQGSTYTDNQGSPILAITPPMDAFFCSITIIEEATFDILETPIPSSTEDSFVNTVTAANNEATATTSEGTGGIAIPTDRAFPEGVTIYGRWKKIKLNGGAIIATIAKY